MTGALTPKNGGSGEADVGNSRGQLQSPRERAAHYRKYAEEFRALAAGEQNASLRGNLMEIVRQYEETAASLDPAPGPGEATHSAAPSGRTASGQSLSAAQWAAADTISLSGSGAKSRQQTSNRCRIRSRKS